MLLRCPGYLNGDAKATVFEDPARDADGYWGPSVRTLGNVLWHFPFFGFVSAALFWLLGLVLTATIIAAPIGLGLMEYGKFLMAPFGRSMVNRADLKGEQNAAWRAYSTIVMLVYLPLGLVLFLLSVVQVFLYCLFLITIPVAIVIAKSLGTTLNPVNKVCVPVAVAEELERRKASALIERHVG